MFIISSIDAVFNQLGIVGAARLLVVNLDAVVDVVAGMGGFVNNDVVAEVEVVAKGDVVALDAVVADVAVGVVVAGLVDNDDTGNLGCGRFKDPLDEVALCDVADRAKKLLPSEGLVELACEIPPKLKADPVAAVVGVVRVAAALVVAVVVAAAVGAVAGVVVVVGVVPPTIGLLEGA